MRSHDICAASAEAVANHGKTRQSPTYAVRLMFDSFASTENQMCRPPDILYLSR